MRQPKDGDVLMLTSGKAAGCLVLVDEELAEDERHNLPFYPDDMLETNGENDEFELLATDICEASFWREYFPSYEIIGRWK